MKRSTAPLFGYACYEGDYAMTNPLSGAVSRKRQVSRRRHRTRGGPSPRRTDGEVDAPVVACVRTESLRPLESPVGSDNGVPSTNLSAVRASVVVGLANRRGRGSIA